MNKSKSIFANRKFSLDGLIEVICVIFQFIGLIVVFVTFCWLFDNYPAETGGALGCIFAAAIVCCVLAGILDTIFPKNNDQETDEWVEKAKKELEKLHAGEDDESN